MSTSAFARPSSPKQAQTDKQAYADDTCDFDLSRMERLVWTGLCKNLTRPTKKNPEAVYTGLAWPSLATLMRYTSSSERSVRRGLRGLESKGWITCVGYAEKGRGHSRKYLLHNPGPKLVQPAKNDGANSPCELDNLPVRAAKLPVQPAKNDGAYKEEILLRKTIKNTPSSRPKTPKPANEDSDRNRWIEARYLRHPKKRSRLKDEEALGSVYDQGPEEQAKFDGHHELICKSHNWNKDGARYCPRLYDYIFDKQYLEPLPDDVAPPQVQSFKPQPRGIELEDLV